MPTSGSGIHSLYILTWKDLSGYERKQFYRENESRVRRGLNPLTKESVNRRRHC